VRISYRITSAAALAGFILFVATDLRLLKLPDTTPVPRVAKSLAAGSVGWDPCMVWEQIPLTVKLSGLFYLGAFAVLIVQGLRNRAAPRLLAVAGLITLAVAANDQRWRVTQCYTSLQVAGFLAWVLTSSLMFLHHVLQRRVRA